jgi:hypothetical protein
MSYLPGNTIIPAEEADASLATLSPLTLPRDRKVIILASNHVNDHSLFLNGLTQNIVILYDLFDSLGFCSYLLQHQADPVERKSFLNSYRTISIHEMVARSMPIHAFIEIGMSVDAGTRGYLRSVGAKIVKLYLGNIINIDIETIQNFKSMFFYHHIVGEIDEIWTSPHYYQHVEYAAILNRTETKNSRVVPYVWDPCFLNQYGARDTMEWIAPTASASVSGAIGAAWHQMDIVIMDPNISFQKCYFYSLLLAEAFSKRYPEWQGKVVLMNGDRIKLSAHSWRHVIPEMSLFQQGRVILHGRKNIHAILKENRSACFLTHQWNNDYNYATLELLHCNYPILHNSEGWSDTGYYYSINEWEAAITTLHRAMSLHKENLPIYRSHAANLIWKHSIHNPSIQARWRSFI